MSRAQWLAFGPTLAILGCKGEFLQALPEAPIADASTIPPDSREDAVSPTETPTDTGAPPANAPEDAASSPVSPPADAAPLEASRPDPSTQPSCATGNDCVGAPPPGFSTWCCYRSTCYGWNGQCPPDPRNSIDATTGVDADVPDSPPESSTTCPSPGFPCNLGDGDSICCSGPEQVCNSSPYPLSVSAPLGCYNLFDIDGSLADGSVACSSPQGTFSCGTFGAASDDGGVPCDRATQYCGLWPSPVQGCISFADSSALYNGAPFPPQCAACPTSACVLGYRPWRLGSGCQCVELDDAGAIGISCGGCYGSPPARLERLLRARATPRSAEREAC